MKAQIASVALSIILGAVLNMAIAVVHVIRNLDKNTITRDICVTGLVGIVFSILNLVSRPAMPIGLFHINKLHIQWSQRHCVAAVFFFGDLHSFLPHAYTPNRVPSQLPYHGLTDGVPTRHSVKWLGKLK